MGEGAYLGGTGRGLHADASNELFISRLVLCMRRTFVSISIVYVDIDISRSSKT